MVLQNIWYDQIDECFCYECSDIIAHRRKGSRTRINVDLDFLLYDGRTI